MIRYRHGHVHIRIFAHVYPHACSHACAHACAHAYAHTCLCTWMHKACAHADTHVYAPAHTMPMPIFMLCSMGMAIYMPMHMSLHWLRVHVCATCLRTRLCPCPRTCPNTRFHTCLHTCPRACLHARPRTHGCTRFLCAQLTGRLMK